MSLILKIDTNDCGEFILTGNESALVALREVLDLQLTLNKRITQTLHIADLNGVPTKIHVGKIIT